MKYLLLLLLVIQALPAQSQKDKWRCQIFLSPAVGKLINETVMYENQQKTSSNRSIGIGGIYYGGGLGFAYRIKKNLLLGIDGSVILKSVRVSRSYHYLNANYQGEGYSREELVFYQASVFAERHFALKNPRWKLVLGTGAFIATEAWILSPKENPQKDAGVLVKFGMEQKWFFSSLEYNQGFIKTTNWLEPYPATSILKLSFGANLVW